MQSRRICLLFLLFSILFPLSQTGHAVTNDPLFTADGLHTETWFMESSGDLSQDLAAAKTAGKTLAIFWEQPGCHFCAKMHEVNLKVEETAQFIQDNFYVVILNMRGSQSLTDFDGNAATAEKVARIHGVTGTPTVEFRNGTGKEVARLPGYAAPRIFHGVFDFVVSKAYETSSLIPWLTENYLNKEN